MKALEASLMGSLGKIQEHLENISFPPRKEQSDTIKMSCNACYDGCWGRSQNGCSGLCGGTCGNNCSNGCERVCTEICGHNCDFGCSHSCSSGCDGNCTLGCDGRRY